jgi:quercetin dioxygenase-like cupin family protein
MAQPRPAPLETFPIARLDLVDEIRQMRASPNPHGHVAKTVVHDRDLRVVLMILARGTTLPRHHAKGSLAIQVLDGRVVIGMLDSSFDLGPGQLLVVAPEIAHGLVAIEDSALMLTIGRADFARVAD